MAQISVTVNGVSKSIEADQRPTHIFSDDTNIVVCKINGELRDLWTELKDGDDVVGISIESPEGLAVLRHSTAHVLAQAVQEVYPETKLGIGPPVTDGFYYDFDPAKPFTPEDLEKLESAMRKIIKSGVKTKVLMLSATPVNTNFSDLRNQLMLASEGDSSNLTKTLNTNKTVTEIFLSIAVSSRNTLNGDIKRTCNNGQAEKSIETIMPVISPSATAAALKFIVTSLGIKSLNTTGIIC